MNGSNSGQTDAHTRHIKLTPSSPALMMSWDAASPAGDVSPGRAGVTTTPLTTPACPLCSPIRVPLRTSQVFKVPSAEPEVTRWTLGAGWGAREVMGSCDVSHFCVEVRGGDLLSKCA